MKWNDPKEKLPKAYEVVLVKLEDGNYELACFKEYLREWYNMRLPKRDAFIDGSEVIGWINPEDIE